MNAGRIFSINVSAAKGVPKEAVPGARLVKDSGLASDAHAGPGIRQVSLLPVESIRSQSALAQKKGVDAGLRAGIYAENITTEGLDLASLKLGDRLRLGREAVLRISKIGKECHRRCEIYHKVGDCIMPREGLFAEVEESGEIRTGDRIELI